MPLEKMDNKGNYTKFPGITTVASVKEKDYLFWEAVYNLVVGYDALKSNYSPLPYASYHMTAINLYTEAAIGSKRWKDFVTNNEIFFQSLQKDFKNRAFEPQISVESIGVSGAIKLLVKLPEEQSQIIHEIAKKYNLQSEIPHEYHITLAYQIKYLEKSALRKIKEELQQKLNELLSLHSDPLFLDAPNLCFFNDMTAFTPWDGAQFPFQEHKNFGLSASFFVKKENADTKDESNKKDGFCNIM